MSSDAVPVRVLLVDDEPTILTRLGAYLVYRGFEVDTAGGGAEALAKLSVSLPDVIICDIMMPEPNGYQVVEILRADNRYADLKIICLSNQPCNAGEWPPPVWTWPEEGPPPYVFAYVGKPFNPSWFPNLINDALAS